MKNIASALVKAQKEFGPALKTHTNPAFKSKYADLSACVEAVIDALNNNGIALIQQTHENDRGVTVETTFLHESGEALSSGRLSVPASKQDPQGYGSALTYARRYSLMAACGIAPEDDDGNAAARKPAAQRHLDSDDQQRKPDVALILKGIAGSTTLDILRSNYESAMQMLDSTHHAAITKATNARKRELNAKQEEAA